MIGLVLIAARRHPLFAAAVFALVVGSAIAYLVAVTPRYRVETTILTQRAQALSPAIRSTVQDDPTRSVFEIVHGRENLLALIQQTNLYTPENAPHGETRPVLVRFLARFSGRFAEGDPLEALVKLLDRTLVVKTNE